MNINFKIALCVSALLAASAASATEYVTNGGFEASSHTGSQAFFGAGQTPATSWTSNGDYVLFCTTSPDCQNIGGVGLQGAVVNSPQGGNFMAFDSDPAFSRPFTQTIAGLTVGQTLDLSFYMATSSEQGSSVITTENLTASLGGETFTTPTITTPAAAFSPWVKYSTSFVYDGANNVLTFLAAGTPSGQPPYALLDGVSLTGGVPEPATWAMMVLGLGGLGLTARLRRQSSTVVA